MPSDESLEAQFDRLKKQLQDTIFKDYPNPERKGCPGEAVLKELAERPLYETPEGNPAWHHVTHCAECYREFLDLREEVRRKSKARQGKLRMVLGIAALLVVAGAFFALRKPSVDRSKRPPNVELAFRQRIVDLEGRAVTRSEEGKGETKPIVLQREPEELAIHLPYGSKEGTYEVRIVKSADHPLLSATGDAKFQNGTTALSTKMDLSDFQQGKYFICVRRVPWDWTCYPVEIQ